MLDLRIIEKELHKRLAYPYHWGRRQNSLWDRETNFIYRTQSFDDLLQKTAKLSQELTDYAMNRWYNFWSAQVVESIFSNHSNVIPNTNQYDRLVDFTINNIPFDHKTSVFPKAYNSSLVQAKQDEEALIQWLYKHQSQQGRKHLKNRLFVVLFDTENQEHWRLKADVILLKNTIDQYMGHFSTTSLKEFDFGQGKVLADIIWLIK